MGYFSDLKYQFGGKITKKHLEKYVKSKNWDGKIFQNLTKTLVNVNLKTLPGLIKSQLTDRKSREPQNPIPVADFDPHVFNDSSIEPKFIWFGHSVLLLRINGKNLLIDPMFGSNAAPIAPFAVKRFSENTLDIIDKLPPIDAILMTHDHYDHLDYHSFQKLKSKVDTFFVALGVGRHLEAWGISENQITELDWWDSLTFQGIEITCTPSRHFGGRGLTDRAKSLWCGWVFKTSEYSIYWSGDGGYGQHFKEVAAKLAPFDWMFVECGQYNKLWHAIHLYPEEAVQAVIDAQAKIAIPVHWGGFSLAMHPWKESIERFEAEAKKKSIRICTPNIGAIVRLGEEPIDNDWYRELK